MLFLPDAFEPLTDQPWDADRVRRAIRAIAADVEAAYEPVELWPAEEWDAWGSPLPLTSLYCGAAGVAWAMDALRRRGHAEVRLDLGAVAERALAAGLDLPAGEDVPEPAAAGLLVGESGLLAVATRLAGHRGHAGALHARVLENVDNPADEVMWGAPGTMLAAAAMHARTGEPRWADAWRGSAERLLARRDPEGLWTQRLFARESRGLGPVHGATGNVVALLSGPLPDPRRAELRESARDLLARTAVVEDGLANWPVNAGDDLLRRDGEIRLQWCHGAPGIVAAAGSYLDEELLLAGAELTWTAGAHGAEKGAGICHGTAGNGYALLAAFARTGDERWLERARRFAVHALAQSARLREQRGRGRYSLWTGDPGVAVFAADCLDARFGYPILASWE